MQERSCGSVGAALTGFAEMAPCLILLALSLILLAPCFLRCYLLSLMLLALSLLLLALFLMLPALSLMLLATCSSCCWCPGSVSSPFLPFPLFWFDWASVQVLGKWIPIICSMLSSGGYVCLRCSRWMNANSFFSWKGTCVGSLRGLTPVNTKSD